MTLLNQRCISTVSGRRDDWGQTRCQVHENCRLEM